MRELPYELCDVFTDRPLAGNALAVFTDADDIDGATMQALARETNLSESAFVIRPTTARRRTPRSASSRRRWSCRLPVTRRWARPSCWPLADSRTPSPSRPRRGVVSVRLSREAGRAGFGWMTQPLPRIEPYREVTKLLAALGVAGSKLPVELYDNGPHYVYRRARHARRHRGAGAGHGTPGRPRQHRLQRLRSNARPGNVACSRPAKASRRIPRPAPRPDPSRSTSPATAASRSATTSSSSKASRSGDRRRCTHARGEAETGSTASRSADTRCSSDRERSGCRDRSGRRYCAVAVAEPIVRPDDVAVTVIRPGVPVD